MPSPPRLMVALAGQQNAGKSTLFNVLTGARQHVANYPGVTVDKKYGQYRDAQGPVQTVDLPGTYSLTSFSLEERVARDFLLGERPEVTVNVVDASNLRRSLHLTLQLLEMELPTVLALNMIDVAERRGIGLDREALAARLGLPVVATIGRKGVGRDALRMAVRAVAATAAAPPPPVDYGALEPAIAALRAEIAAAPALTGLPSRWLALKLLEADEQAQRLVQAAALPDLLETAAARRAAFEASAGGGVGDHVVACRDRAVAALLAGIQTGTGEGRTTISDRIDRLVLNRWAAPLFLVLTVFLIYQVSIVWGYELTNYTWPLLAALRDGIAGLLPAAGLLVDPWSRALGLWLVDSANTLLNYVPIFLILFAAIAVIEDTGYMARIAFILDKVLHRFGLHGQSTLPLILGGVFAGGCAVPGVMATKGIPDHRARLATIFTVPFMNCLAKVPLYTLLLGAFFSGQERTLMMFYISTMTIIFALLVAKLLTGTLLRGQETSPFVMELPHYHLPTPSGVLRRALERTWQYVKKVGTIVLAVAVVVFTLLHVPGLPAAERAAFEAEGEAAVQRFAAALADNPLRTVALGEHLVPLLNFADDYRRARLGARSAEAARAIDARFAADQPDFFRLVRPPRGDADAGAAARALRDLARTRTTLRREIREQRIVHSVLGAIGRGMEPVTQFAGFDWKINVALLSSFAARESSVATLGVLFQQDEDQNLTLEERMGTATAAGSGALLAVSMILFFALYPPCLATTIMVRVQTGSYRWMLFSIVFPTLLGLVVASAVFSIGQALGASGIAAMSVVYFGALGLLLLVGLISGWRARSPARAYA